MTNPAPRPALRKAPDAHVNPAHPQAGAVTATRDRQPASAPVVSPVVTPGVAESAPQVDLRSAAATTIDLTGAASPTLGVAVAPTLEAPETAVLKKATELAQPASDVKAVNVTAKPSRPKSKSLKDAKSVANTRRTKVEHLETDGKPKHSHSKPKHSEHKPKSTGSTPEATAIKPKAVHGKPKRTASKPKDTHGKDTHGKAKATEDKVTVGKLTKPDATSTKADAVTKHKGKKKELTSKKAKATGKAKNKKLKVAKKNRVALAAKISPSTRQTVRTAAKARGTSVNDRVDTVVNTWRER